MYTLIFLSAQQLVKDEEATCKILESVPCIVYDVLFKVAYRENKTKVLCDLVKMWPYSRFKFQELLQTCWCSSRSLSRSPSRNCQECQEIIDYDESSINKIDAIILGVLNYIKKANTDDSQQLPRRDLPYPLQSLQLSYCSLTEKDLTYMAQSHHSAHLIKLDLSCNRLTEQRDSFLKLLKSVSNSLKWLNITNCGLNDADFDEISSYLYSCTSLSHLGLHGNSLSKRSLIAFLEPSLCKLLNMKIISVPIFSDCYRNLRTSKQYDESSDFLSILNETKSTQLTREGLTITLTYNSLSDVGDYFDLR
uniref:Leucine-rich repeat-containing protein 41 n=1 Tax=Sarcophilus harrisii TaxID=9305 RepID=A0A7N4NQD4_SARHA